MTAYHSPILVLTATAPDLEQLLTEIEPAFEYYWQELAFFRCFISGQRMVLGSLAVQPEAVLKQLMSEYHPELIILAGEIGQELAALVEAVAGESVELQRVGLKVAELENLLGGAEEVL